ncbi:MAG TPA: hypothetical protein VM141_01640 [Planctomycetota bacterium]|nr:hypothetical protein [Planctomycetota bacterium]
MAATGGISATTTCNTGTISRPGNGKAASITKAYAASGALSTTAPQGPQGDRIELSDRGLMLGRAIEIARPLKDVPDVRPEKIEEARKLIESGELFSKDAIRQAARHIKDILREW